MSPVDFGRCDSGAHCACLIPPLKAVPVGNWFCDACHEPSDADEVAKDSTAWFLTLTSCNNSLSNRKMCGSSAFHDLEKRLPYCFFREPGNRGCLACNGKWGGARTTYFKWSDIANCQSLDEATPPLSDLHKYVLLAIILDRPAAGSSPGTYDTKSIQSFCLFVYLVSVSDSFAYMHAASPFHCGVCRQQCNSQSNMHNCKR